MIKVLFDGNHELQQYAYLLIFLGAGLPSVLIGKFMFPLKGGLSACFVRTLLYTTFLYMFIRFIGMGASPNLLCWYLSFAAVALVISLNLLKLIKSISVLKNVQYINAIGSGLSVLSLIISTCGYIYNIPFSVATLANRDVLRFINEFGLKNVVLLHLFVFVYHVKNNQLKFL